MTKSILIVSILFGFICISANAQAQTCEKANEMYTAGALSQAARDKACAPKAEAAPAEKAEGARKSTAPRAAAPAAPKPAVAPAKATTDALEALTKRLDALEARNKELEKKQLNEFRLGKWLKDNPLSFLVIFLCLFIIALAIFIYKRTEGGALLQVANENRTLAREVQALRAQMAQMGRQPP